MQTNLLHLIFIAGLALVLTACQNAEPNSKSNLVKEGRALVSENCLSCHSLSPSIVSPRSDAPALSTVLSAYNSESLTDDFREGIHVGHPDMPDFDFGPKGTDALIAYLKSIQE